jgi:hypothetical protein
MSRRQRDKGKRGERELATMLRDLFPELAEGIRRGWQTRHGGKDEADIEGLPFHPEVAVGISPPIRAKMAQAVRDSNGGRTPIVFTRRDRDEWLVTMRFSDWAKMARP